MFATASFDPTLSLLGSLARPQSGVGSGTQQELLQACAAAGALSQFGAMLEDRLRRTERIGRRHDITLEPEIRY